MVPLRLACVPYSRWQSLGCPLELHPPFPRVSCFPLAECCCSSLFLSLSLIFACKGGGVAQVSPAGEWGRDREEQSPHAPQLVRGISRAHYIRALLRSSEWRSGTSSRTPRRTTTSTLNPRPHDVRGPTPPQPRHGSRQRWAPRLCAMRSRGGLGDTNVLGGSGANASIASSSASSRRSWRSLTSTLSWASCLLPSRPLQRRGRKCPRSWRSWRRPSEELCFVAGGRRSVLAQSHKPRKRI